MNVYMYIFKFGIHIYVYVYVYLHQAEDNLNDFSLCTIYVWSYPSK